MKGKYFQTAVLCHRLAEILSGIGIRRSKSSTGSYYIGNASLRVKQNRAQTAQTEKTLHTAALDKQDVPNLEISRLKKERTPKADIIPIPIIRPYK